MQILYIIPARGGSKGIPRKNIKLLGGKPLIHYSIATARSLARDEDICVSTEDKEIKSIAEATGLKVPFLRPTELSTDHAGSYEVLLHALDFYSSVGKQYELIVLLQPTSPFRTDFQVREIVENWTPDLQMIVSVKETKSNPYYVLYEENNDGFLIKSKTAKLVRRQDCPPVYELNGAIYAINVEALRQKHLGDFTFVKKYVMDEITSIDLDTPLDWEFAEFLISNKSLNLPLVQ